MKYLFSGGTPKIILLEFKVLEDQCYDSLPTPLTSIEDEIMYPYIAYKAGVEGKIVFRFDITTKGELENLKILKGIGAFIDEEIVATFKNIRFKPAYYKGKAVASKIQMALLFKIED